MKLHRVVVLLLLAAALLLLTAGKPVKRGPGARESGTVLVENGYLTDAGAEAIYSLPFFTDPPNLPKFYFSADATGFLALGVDTNPCTIEEPCRSLTKAAQLSNTGNAWIVLDDGDVWEQADDWGPVGCAFGATCNQKFTLGPFNQCKGGEEELCVIWSDFDLNPLTGPPSTTATRPTIDCGTGNVDINDRLFELHNDVYAGGDDDGWAGFANMQTLTCPDSAADDTGDIFACQGGAGTGCGLLLLNWNSPGISGNLNEVITHHNSNYHNSIALNLECTITDPLAADGAICVYGLGGSYYLIGDTHLRSTVASLSGINVIRAGHVNNSLFVMGHTISCVAGGGGISKGISVDNANAAFDTVAFDGKRYTAIVDVTIDGCSGASDYGIQTNMNVVPTSGNLLDIVRIFRPTVSGSALAMGFTNTGATNSRDVQIICPVIDNNSSYTISFDSVPPNDSDLIVRHGLYEDTDVANSFLMGATAYAAATDVVTAADDDFPSQALFDMTDLGGVSPWNFASACTAAATPYPCCTAAGVGATCNNDAQLKCSSGTAGSCENQCPESFVYSFPDDDYIPKAVLGKKITGVILNTDKNQNIGAK